MVSESSKIQAFIDSNSTQLLRDALVDIELCPAERLPQLLHRLKGSVGTYQMMDLYKSLHALYQGMQGENSATNLENTRMEISHQIESQLMKRENK